MAVNIELPNNKDALNEYFTQYNTEIDTNHIAEILNEWTDDSDRLYTHEGLRKGIHKIMILPLVYSAFIQKMILKNAKAGTIKIF